MAETRSMLRTLERFLEQRAGRGSRASATATSTRCVVLAGPSPRPSRRDPGLPAQLDQLVARRTTRIRPRCGRCTAACWSTSQHPRRDGRGGCCQPAQPAPAAVHRRGPRPMTTDRVRRSAALIAGVGSASGVRLVVGHWTESPLGRFADVDGRDGRRPPGAARAHERGGAGSSQPPTSLRRDPGRAHRRRRCRADRVAGAVAVACRSTLCVGARVRRRLGPAPCRAAAARARARAWCAVDRPRSPASCCAVSAPAASRVPAGVSGTEPPTSARCTSLPAPSTRSTSADWPRSTRRAASASPRRRAVPRSPPSSPRLTSSRLEVLASQASDDGDCDDDAGDGCDWQGGSETVRCAAARGERAGVGA